MRVLRRGAAPVALAALLLPGLLSAGARADELLVMPYTCTVAGGQPVLTPGPETGHRIIGRRDQRRHKACSPVNPDMCRSWTVHRFDLDCDGRRVSWVSVVAATHEGNRRAWLLDGRLLLRMGPRWSLAPDDPCAQRSGPDERPAYGGELRRECAQRLAMAPPAVVEMPFGYAPMLGIDGIFVAAKTPPAGVAKAQPTLPPVVAAEPQPKPADAKPPLPAPKEAELPPAAAPVPQQAPKVASTPKAAPAAPLPVEAPKKAEAEPQPSAPKLATPPLPAKEGTRGPRIVTIPPAPAAVEGAKKDGERKEAGRPSAPSQAKPATAEPATPAEKIVAAPAPKLAERPAPAVKPAPESAYGVFRPTSTGAIVAFAGLALGLLAAFALARRREHARDIAGRRRRDVSALSLDGRPAKAPVRPGAVARPRSQRGPSTLARPSAPSKPAAQPPPAPPPDLTRRLAVAADESDRLPRTREEALEVLGIGIAPSASPTAIKKIVDGLRMSWHPDFAKDETDRALREQRSKQINAAWAILQSERAEV